MNFAESIKKARERGLTDDQILDAIRKQNPHKEGFFKSEKEKGLSSTAILENMMGGTDEKGEEKETFDGKISPDMFAHIPSKPSEETKVWVRVAVTLVLTAVTALSFTVLYRAFFVPRLRPIEPEVHVREIYMPRAPSPLIRLYPEKDDIQRFAITIDEEYKMHLRRIVREEDDGEIIRIIAEDQREGRQDARILDLEDFFRIFEIEFHEDDFEEFFEKIEKDFNLYVYTKEAQSRLGFVVPFSDGARDAEDVEYSIMRRWEERTMAENFEEFFNFWNESIDLEGGFAQTTHKGEMPVSFDIRYKEGTGGMGIYYTLTEDLLIFSTSLESIKILIERYYEL